MAMKAVNESAPCVGLQQQPQQQLSCPSQALLFDLACDPHLLRPHDDEANIHLCLTCGSPVFRDDAEQESDFTSPFCLDCFSVFHSRDSAYDDINLHDDASISDTDDDEDYEDCNRSHGSCCGGSMALEGPDLPLSVGFHFMNGGNTIMRTA